MAVPSCANLRGKLRVGQYGLIEPHGFWLFLVVFFVVFLSWLRPLLYCKASSASAVTVEVGSFVF